MLLGRCPLSPNTKHILTLFFSVLRAMHTCQMFCSSYGVIPFRFRGSGYPLQNLRRMPVFSGMFRTMLSTCKNSKIIRTVIKTILIDVMDDFMLSKRASQHLFHYQTMFHLLGPIWHGKKPVPPDSYRESAMPRMVIDPTEPSFVLSGYDPLAVDGITPLLERAFSCIAGPATDSASIFHWVSTINAWMSSGSHTRIILNDGTI